MEGPSELVQAGWPGMGYARYSAQDTIVIAAVFGPYESKSSVQSNYTKGLVNVIVSDVFFKTNTEEYEGVLKGVFDTVIDLREYPYLSITVSFQFIRKGGQLLASCVNAGYRAVLHSGLKVRHSVIAEDFNIDDSQLTLGIVPNTDLILLSKMSRPIPLASYKSCLASLYLKSNY